MMICVLLAAMVAAAAASDAPVAAPTNLAWAASGSAVSLQWDAPAAGGTPTAYIIEAGSRPGLANLAILNTGTAATRFSTSGVASGVYFVRVRAVNASGAGNPSNEIAVIVGACAAPVPPSALTVATSGRAISLAWTAASGAPTSYVLEAGSAPGQSNLSNSELLSANTSFTATGVASGMYFVRLRARNACGTSEPSNEVVATVGSAGIAASYVPGARFNAACSTQGALGNSAGILICDGGKWRYALAADAPQPLHGGYPARPDWYPTLAGSWGSRMACPEGGVRLTQSPLPVDQLVPFNPYGVMVGDHVTPIDHGYLAIKSLAKPVTSRTESDYVPITTPAPGVIIELSSLGSPTSNRVVIDHGCGIFTVMMVINRPTGVLAPYADRVTRGERVDLALSVDAGVEIGRQRDNPLDFNVFDQNAWLPGFANVFSYAGEAWKPYTASPTPYFTPALANVFESLSLRTQPPRWGKIDYDVAGTAQGNWFLDGTLGYSCWLEQDAANATAEIKGGPIAGKNGGSYCHMSLSPHWTQPGQIMASFGWWINPDGDFVQMLIKLASGQPAPSQLTAASGVTVYELDFANQEVIPSGPPRGFLAVRVNEDDTLTVETLPGATSASAFTGFTANQRKYHR